MTVKIIINLLSYDIFRPESNGRKLFGFNGNQIMYAVDGTKYSRIRSKVAIAENTQSFVSVSGTFFIIENYGQNKLRR